MSKDDFEPRVSPSTTNRTPDSGRRVHGRPVASHQGSEMDKDGSMPKANRLDAALPHDGVAAVGPDLPGLGADLAGRHVDRISDGDLSLPAVLGI